MLGKLLKQDMKATSRMFVPAFLVFSVVTILNKIMMEINLANTFNSHMLDMFYGIFLTLYVISIVAIYVANQLFIIIHFYRTMAGQQGYLTHTLPVKTSTLVNSKLLISVFWGIVTCFMICLSFLVLALGHFSLADTAVLIHEIFSGIDLIWSAIIEEGLAAQTILVGVEFIILVVLSAISTPLMYFLSIAIGNMFNRNKVAGSLVAYIGIYVILQFISVAIIMFSNFYTLFDQTSANSAFRAFHGFILAILIYSIIETVVFYVGTERIFSKKLNLQ